MSRHGAVSPSVAVQMAQGVKSVYQADYGLGVTGIAGPTGATKQKPVGLVYVGLSSPCGASSKEFRFVGDREIIKRRASQMALDMLRRELLHKV